jgi:hypothetical protein
MSGQNYIGTLRSCFDRIALIMAGRRATKLRVRLLRIMPSHEAW